MWWTWELGAEKGQIKRGIAEGKGDYESGSGPGKTDFFLNSNEQCLILKLLKKVETHL